MLPDSIEFRVDKLGKQHEAGLFSLLNNPAVADWLGGFRSMDAVVKSIEVDEQTWRGKGFGTLVALDHGSSRVLGRAGVRATSIESRDEIELFYTVLPEAWGRSLATQLSRQALDYYFKANPSGSVVGFTLPENKASVRVLNKLGFAYERNVIHAERDHVLYRLRLTP